MQAAVTLCGIAVAAGQQRETLGQRVVHGLQAEERHPRRGHLQRQRQAVELSADGDQQRQRLGIGAEAMVGRGNAFDQQRQCAVAGIGGRPGQREWLQPLQLFTGHRQRQLAGDEQVHTAQGPQQRRQFGAGADHVFGVVQHQQQRLAV